MTMTEKEKEERVRLVKAYNNKEFLNSPPARLIRIMAEMLEPADRFKKYGVRDTVVMFGSARVFPKHVAVACLKEIETRLELILIVSCLLGEL